MKIAVYVQSNLKNTMKVKERWMSVEMFAYAESSQWLIFKNGRSGQPTNKVKNLCQEKIPALSFFFISFLYKKEGGKRVGGLQPNRSWVVCSLVLVHWSLEKSGRKQFETKQKDSEESQDDIVS